MKTSLYEKLVFIAYGYFILLGLIRLIGLLIFTGEIDYWATAAILIFGTQAYFRRKLTNLILGVLTFGLSIFVTLQIIWYCSKAGFNFYSLLALALSVISILLSILLIFSYTKLSFKDQ